MRVYIGPYINRWVSRFDEKWIEWRYKDCHWNIHEDQYDRWDHLAEKIDDVLQWVYNHTINLYLDRKERKVRVKLHRYDTWSMDSTLAYIILPMLKQLKETTHSSPHIDDEDVPEQLRSTSAPPKEDEYDLDDNYHARWDWVLDELIWTFTQKCRDWWQEDYIIEHGELDLDNKEKIEYEGQTYHELKWKKEGKYDREGEKAHQERMSNGFRLFGKYFEALWT